MYPRPRARTARVLGDLFIDASSEFRIKFHHRSSPLFIFSGGRASEQGREGESERLSHQLIKSLTADSSWGLAAAATAAAAAGEQTDIARCQKKRRRERNMTQKALFLCRRRGCRDDDDDDATRGEDRAPPIEEAQFH